MKNCPRCNAQLEDNAVFCQNCGFSVAQQAEPQAQQPQYNQYAAAPAPVVDQYDHTAEFSAEDVSENKLLAAVIYVSSILGIIVALIAAECIYIRKIDFVSCAYRDLCIKRFQHFCKHFSYPAKSANKAFAVKNRTLVLIHRNFKIRCNNFPFAVNLCGRYGKHAVF
jgi:hypothetical protein